MALDFVNARFVLSQCIPCPEKHRLTVNWKNCFEQHLYDFVSCASSVNFSTWMSFRIHRMESLSPLCVVLRCGLLCFYSCLPFRRPCITAPFPFHWEFASYFFPSLIWSFPPTLQNVQRSHLVSAVFFHFQEVMCCFHQDLADLLCGISLSYDLISRHHEPLSIFLLPHSLKLILPSSP